MMTDPSILLMCFLMAVIALGVIWSPFWWYTHWKPFHEKWTERQIEALWRARFLKSKIVLDLSKSNCAVCNPEPITPSNRAMTFVLRHDVERWCRENMTGYYYWVPAMIQNRGSYCAMLWFENEDDAFMFKMRWL